MENSSHSEPLNIALGLESLAIFIGTAGFSEASRLVEMAAMSAREEIERTFAEQPLREKLKGGSLRRPHTGSAPLHTRRNSLRHT